MINKKSKIARVLVLLVILTFVISFNSYAASRNYSGSFVRNLYMGGGWGTNISFSNSTVYWSGNQTDDVRYQIGTVSGVVTKSLTEKYGITVRGNKVKYSNSCIGSKVTGTYRVRFMSLLNPELGSKINIDGTMYW